MWRNVQYIDIRIYWNIIEPLSRKVCKGCILGGNDKWVGRCGPRCRIACDLCQCRGWCVMFAPTTLSEKSPTLSWKVSSSVTTPPSSFFRVQWWMPSTLNESRLENNHRAGIRLTHGRNSHWRVYVNQYFFLFIYMCIKQNCFFCKDAVS